MNPLSLDAPPRPDAAIVGPESSVSNTPHRPPPEVTLADVTTALLRHRRLILLAGLVGATVLGVATYTRPRTYTATASFTPEAYGGMRSQLAGLASQFGVGMFAQEAGKSPAFFADLLRSRGVLRAVASDSFTVRTPGGVQQGTLADHFDIVANEPGRRLEATVDRLHRKVDATVGRETGIVRVSVRASSPELAFQLQQRLLDEMAVVNQRMRRSQAEAEREFTEERLDEARVALRIAEDRVRDFLRRNRDYSRSPDLLSEYERLARDASMQRDLYSSLAQSVVQSRMDALRNTPVVTLVEPPTVPARPDARGTLLNAILGALGAAGLAGMAVLARSFGGRPQRTAVRP